MKPVYFTVLGIRFMESQMQWYDGSLSLSLAIWDLIKNITSKEKKKKTLRSSLDIDYEMRIHCRNICRHYCDCGVLQNAVRSKVPGEDWVRGEMGETGWQWKRGIGTAPHNDSLNTLWRMNQQSIRLPPLGWCYAWLIKTCIYKSGRRKSDHCTNEWLHRKVMWPRDIVLYSPYWVKKTWKWYIYIYIYILFFFAYQLHIRS